MIPKFAKYQSGSGAELLCPACEGTYLHHGTVEVFECGEDAEHGVHVTVSDGKATMDTSLKGNPSSRRHGLKINFWCEQCHATSVLLIKQHKGNTEVDFNILEQPKTDTKP
jgi:hypothetical protein